MPVATEIVHSALAKGTDLLEGVKRGKGIATAPLRLAVTVVEKPVVWVLDSSLGKTGLRVGDRCVKFADGTVDGAMNSSVVKTTGRMYSTSTTYVSETSDRISCVYQGSLSTADDIVERFLPGDDKELPITPRVLVTKVGRRTVKRVQTVPSNLRKVAVRTRATVSTTLDQARPANVRKNTVIVYKRAMTSADSLVDYVLPDDEPFVATGPLTLSKKVTCPAQSQFLVSCFKTSCA
jgi:hypothetical protein